MKQGEIYRVNLDPVVGHEIGGESLAVVVSDDRINATFLPVVVVPLADATGALPPLVYSAIVTAAESGLGRDLLAECLQVRAIDRTRFAGTPEGTLSHATMKAIEKALQKVFQV